jgi:hypothetical protein
MMPTTWMFRPWVEVVATAYRKIAPTAISVMAAPVLISRPVPFTGAPSCCAAPCGGRWSGGW